MPLQEGSLTDLIIEKKAPDHATLCTEVLKQCLSALAFLSSEKVIHRDVKPDNILYNPLPDNKGFLRLEWRRQGEASRLANCFPKANISHLPISFPFCCWSRRKQSLALF